jgi:hypothetical protein
LSGFSEPGLGLFDALFRGPLFDGWFRRKRSRLACKVHTRAVKFKLSQAMAVVSL